MKIRLLEHSQIDKARYDSIVMSSAYGTVYAMSWYLDAVSPEWMLLTTDDNRYIMPLPIKRKWGIKMALQPMFSQQLGVFSKDKITADIFKEFLRKMPCRIYSINSNVGNEQTDLRGVRFLPRTNYTLTEKRYRENFLRNVKKSYKEDLHIDTDTEWTAFIDMLKVHTKIRSVYDRISYIDKVFTELKKYCNIEVWSVKNNSNEMLSAAMFLYWKDRTYYILPVSTPEGKRSHSMNFLLDNFIDVCIKNNLILDFEGSSLQGVARYYQSMGAVKEIYYCLQKPYWLFRVFR
jgi:hypothetical protein